MNSKLITYSINEPRFWENLSYGTLYTANFRCYWNWFENKLFHRICIDKMHETLSVPSLNWICFCAQPCWARSLLHQTFSARCHCLLCILYHPFNAIWFTDIFLYIIMFPLKIIIFVMFDANILWNEMWFIHVWLNFILVIFWKFVISVRK